MKFHDYVIDTATGRVLNKHVQRIEDISQNAIWTCTMARIDPAIIGRVTPQIRAEWTEETADTPGCLSIHVAETGAPLSISLFLRDGRHAARLRSIVSVQLRVTREVGLEPSPAWPASVTDYPAVVTLPLPTDIPTMMALQPIAGDLVKCWAAAFFGTPTIRPEASAHE